MKVKQFGFWALTCLVYISVFFLFSCSSKEVKKEGLVSKPPAAVGDEAENAKKRVRIKEQEEMREKARREEEAKRLKAMAEKSRFESEDIHFDFDQYILSEKDKEIVNKKAQWLKENLAAKFLIEGHCDERGSAEYNLALGQKRAEAAMNYLTALGINANRISTTSYGEEKPLDPGSNEAAWAKNRRAHFVLK